MTTKPNYKTAEYGHLYCLSNDTHSNMVKIGITTTKTPHQRAKELSGTSVPTPFRVEFAKYIRHPYQREQELHRLLQERGMRINHKREHFRMTPYEALQYFHLLDGEWSPPPSPYLMCPSRPIYGQPPLSRLLSPIRPRMDKYDELESQEVQEPGAAPYALISTAHQPQPQPQPLIPQERQRQVATCDTLTLVIGLCLIFYFVLSA
jgi:hypothetical protein